ncbi:hypothetical protein ABFS83_09G058800 [Erythranthe nasuta]
MGFAIPPTRGIARNNNRNNCRTQIRSQEEVCSISLLIGARAKIPLADGYFGNGAYIAKTSISETELLQNGLGYAGLKIKAFVAKQNREEVVKFVEDWIEKRTMLRKGSIISNLLITSSPRHNVYGSDFGWGKPLAVRSGKGQKFDGKVTTFPAVESTLKLACRRRRCMQWKMMLSSWWHSPFDQNYCWACFALDFIIFGTGL